MKRILAILTLAVTVAFGARAVDITLTGPGTLASQIGQCAGSGQSDVDSTGAEGNRDCESQYS